MNKKQILGTCCFIVLVGASYNMKYTVADYIGLVALCLFYLMFMYYNRTIINPIFNDSIMKNIEVTNENLVEIQKFYADEAAKKNSQEAKLVLLPTKRTGMNGSIILSDDKLIYSKELIPFPAPEGHTLQDLYLINTEKVKNGDWYLVELFDVTGKSTGLHLEQCKSINDVWVNNDSVINTRHIENCKKIIATTNPEVKTYLGMTTDGESVFIDNYEHLPKISNETIQEFIKANGQGYNNVLFYSEIDSDYVKNTYPEKEFHDTPVSKDCYAITAKPIPTLENIKQYFKNAKAVKSMVKGINFQIDIDSIYETPSGFYAHDLTWEVKGLSIYNKSTRTYADIIEGNK